MKQEISGIFASNMTKTIKSMNRPKRGAEANQLINYLLKL